jgi:hypothetical protein
VATPRIRSIAVLIGYDRDGKCVYSDILELSDYYDGEHVWDQAASVKKLKLERVKGYLFDSAGNLDQEFESVFDLSTGIYKGGYTKYADGTTRRDGEEPTS